MALSALDEAGEWIAWYLFAGQLWIFSLLPDILRFLLSTVKSLQAEYAALMAEKKEAYSDYRRVREEMKELLTAKANVDRILEKDTEREHRESEEKAIL